MYSSSLLRTLLVVLTLSGMPMLELQAFAYKQDAQQVSLQKYYRWVDEQSALCAKNGSDTTKVGVVVGLRAVATVMAKNHVNAFSSEQAGKIIVVDRSDRWFKHKHLQAATLTQPLQKVVLTKPAIDVLDALRKIKCDNVATPLVVEVSYQDYVSQGYNDIFSDTVEFIVPASIK